MQNRVAKLRFAVWNGPFGTGGFSPNGHGPKADYT